MTFAASTLARRQRPEAQLAGVFLSYAREDMTFVSRLHQALATAGRDPAWDQDHQIVPFSAPYRAEIATAITASDKFIFVISPHSLASTEETKACWIGRPA